MPWVEGTDEESPSLLHVVSGSSEYAQLRPVLQESYPYPEVTWWQLTIQRVWFVANLRSRVVELGSDGISRDAAGRSQLCE